MRQSAVWVTLALCAMPSLAAGLELRYAALERLIAEQMFTHDGRHYVRGSPQDRCQYAYLEAPHLGPASGRLRITAKFSGRSAVGLFGRCVGMGDSFDFTVTATPVAKNGAIGLEGVDVTTQRDSYYIRRVRDALAQSFAKDFKIDVREQAKKLLGQTPEKSPEKSAVTTELKDFALSQVSLTEEAIVLEVEFKLVVK
jgi:hypothetical protein